LGNPTSIPIGVSEGLFERQTPFLLIEKSRAAGRSLCAGADSRGSVGKKRIRTI
jgi:hypothetical protein